MAYSGDKFKGLKVLEKIAPYDLRIPQLIAWCKRFDKYSLAPPYEGGSFGNLSFRVEEGSPENVITCSNTALGGRLLRGNFAQVISCDVRNASVLARRVRPGRKPSSEEMIHYMIYCERPKINAVFHGHFDPILGREEEFGIPVTSKEDPYGTPRLVRITKEIVHDGNIIMMKGHGFISMGTTMQEAGIQALEMLLNFYKAD